jgi:hypothetical protein
MQDKNCRHASRKGDDCQTPDREKAAIPASGWRLNYRQEATVTIIMKRSGLKVDVELGGEGVVEVFVVVDVVG